MVIANSISSLDTRTVGQRHHDALVRLTERLNDALNEVPIFNSGLLESADARRALRAAERHASMAVALVEHVLIQVRP